MIAYCMKRFVELLDNRLFLRVSRNCLVRRNLVSFIDEEGKVFSKDKQIAKFSRRYLKAYLES